MDNPSSAINEETGEIDWDCPCLEGALKPPCGDTFKKAFGCFVNSKTEPKGSDCLEAFESMQKCFKKYPEIYLKDDEDDFPTSSSSHGNKQQSQLQKGSKDVDLDAILEKDDIVESIMKIL